MIRSHKQDIGVVPKPAHGIAQYALPIAAQISFHFYEARTELTALDHAACHNILRRESGLRIAEMYQRYCTSGSSVRLQSLRLRDWILP